MKEYWLTVKIYSGIAIISFALTWIFAYADFIDIAYYCFLIWVATLIALSLSSAIALYKKKNVWRNEG